MKNQISRDEISNSVAIAVNDATAQRKLLHPEQKEVLVAFIKSGHKFFDSVATKFVENSTLPMLKDYLKHKHQLPKEALPWLIKRGCAGLFNYLSYAKLTEEEELLIVQNDKLRRNYIKNLYQFAETTLHESTITWLCAHAYWNDVLNYITQGNELPPFCQVKMVEHGDARIIRAYINEGWQLCDDAEVLLVETGDQDLISEYMEDYALCYKAQESIQSLHQYNDDAYFFDD